MSLLWAAGISYAFMDRLINGIVLEADFQYCELIC